MNFEHTSASVYRGAQPTQASLENLAKLGVKTVINLRDDPLPGEEDTAEALGLCYVPMPMSGIAAPTGERMEQILSVIDASPKPVFIHCQYGCDRTGTVIACWRIRHGWTNEDALREAKAYGLSDLLPHFASFIKQFKGKQQ